MAPGHSPAGKAGDAAFALAFAHRGFAVLSYDPIGQGERLQYPDPANPGHTLLKAPTGEHGEAGLQPTLMGDALARYFLIDAIRATDYLLTRPEIDPARIGAFGCSGGGLMTALTAALDTRIAVAGIACFTTSFDTLLPSIGPQDSEQSIPNFIASGLDFPDWSELFAPKPYAIIATTEDMFPFAGAQSTEKESRAFYTLFNASDNLAFITGPGRHGNLRPILPQILDFFTTHLHPTHTTDPSSPPESQSAAAERPAGEAATRPAGPPPPALPPADTQVTPTGQVATSYPQSETVYTLNLKRASQKLPHPHQPFVYDQLNRAIRDVTHAAPTYLTILSATAEPDQTIGSHTQHNLFLHDPGGIDLQGTLAHPTDASSATPTHHPAILFLTDTPLFRSPTGAPLTADEHHFLELADGGNVVLAITPRPSPAGTEETKSPVLGAFYLTELRAELVGKTLLGLRMEDVGHALNYLGPQPGVNRAPVFYNPGNIDPDRRDVTAEASGHMALVLLHAAIFSDFRLKHITLHALPPTYTEYLHQPIPHDAPQDILPGVLLHYDTPDLIRALGSRVTVEHNTSTVFKNDFNLMGSPTLHRRGMTLVVPNASEFKRGL